MSLTFEESELIINLEKGKTESVLLGTQKIIKNLQGKGLIISVKAHASTNTFFYRTWAST